MGYVVDSAIVHARDSAKNRRMSRLPCVVMAAVPLGISAMTALLGEQFRLVATPTYDEAVRAIRDEAPDAIIVGYFFDELRSDRLIRRIRADLAKNVPILMVQAFPVERGRLEAAEVRQTYQTLGVEEFIDLTEIVQRLGKKEAGRELAGIVRRLIASRSVGDAF